MDYTKVRVVKNISHTTTVKVANIDGAFNIDACVTSVNNRVNRIENIQVTDSNRIPIWEGSMNPNITGSFFDTGKEVEVMTALREFADAVYAEDNENDNSDEQ